MSLVLGIDTGGTYTDAVIIEGETILANAKSLTTRYNLAEGIENVILKLPDHLRTNLSMVSLSTTLATNAVVEGQGANVLGIFPGYQLKQLEKVNLFDVISPNYAFCIDGGHNAFGQEKKPLDINLATQIIEKYAKDVSAIAISSLFSIRNGEHEQILYEVAKKYGKKPITLGSDLALALDAPRRALTAVLNARLINFIHELIDSLSIILKKYHIDAPIMIVKGDGSLVNEKTALERPVETVLSGPAASVMGAKFLAKEKNIIVADMGGTTTDIAFIKDGEPVISYDGAMVGEWSPMVRSVEVHSIGLGGDSEVKFGGEGRLTIGPRRVMPMSLLGHTYPDLIERLKRQVDEDPSPRSNRFAVMRYSNDLLLRGLDKSEEALWDRLQDSPICLDDIVFESRELSRAIPRLERKGMLIYTGFTPTDAAHVLGRSDHWSKEAAELAAKIWIRQMRRVYGLGLWDFNDITQACKDIMHEVVMQIGSTLIKVGLLEGRYVYNKQIDHMTKLLVDLLIYKKEHNHLVFDLDFAKDYTLLALGAPAASYYPQVGSIFGMDVCIPEYGYVSNAIGAVVSKVAQEHCITITEMQNGLYRVHSTDVKDFETLTKAKDYATLLAKEKAKEKAVNAGAKHIHLEQNILENKVSNSVDGDVFFEANIIVKAIGTL